MKIKHWMTSNPITVKPSTLVVEASKIMKEHGVRRLPVVDKGKVVGRLTHRNIYGHLAFCGHPLERARA